MQETITIRIQAIDEATKTINQVAKTLKILKLPKLDLDKNLGFDKIIIRGKAAKTKIQEFNAGLTDISTYAKFAGTSVKKFNSALDEVGIRFVKGVGFIDKYSGKLVDYNKATMLAAKQTKRFKFEYLGLLFFAMQINRTFKRITITSTSFYMKMTEGQTMASQGMTRLSASFQFLKFSIGDAIATALLPLIPAIVDIIDAISGWISQHPKLVASILLVGIALTSLLVFAISLKFAWTGLSTIFLASKKIFLMIGGLLQFLMSPIGLIIAAVVLLAIMWEKNLFGIREKVAWFVGWLIKWGWNNTLRYFFIFIGKAVKHMYLAWKFALYSMQWVAAKIWNGIVKIFEWGINLVIDFINTLLAPLRKLLGLVGIELPRLSRVTFRRMMVDTSGLADKIKQVTEETKNLWTTGWDWGMVSEKTIENIKKSVAEFSIVDALKSGAKKAIGLVGEILPTGGETNNINISNVNVSADNPERFAEELQKYVEIYGGSKRNIV